MIEGIIKAIDKEKGFGFVVSESVPSGAFFHASSVKGSKFDDLNKGDRVTVEEHKEGFKGIYARGLRLLQDNQD